MDTIDGRAFGQLEGEVRGQSARIEAHGRVLSEIRAEWIEQTKVVNAELAAQTKALADIRATLDEARGGWKTLIWIAGAASTLAGVITWALTNLKWKGGP